MPHENEGTLIINLGPGKNLFITKMQQEKRSPWCSEFLGFFALWVAGLVTI